MALAAQRMRRAVKLEILEARQALFIDTMTPFVDAFLAGDLRPLEFQQLMMQEYKGLAISSYMAGRGGTWTDAGPQEWGRVGAVIRRQYGFIRGFAFDMATREPPMSRAQILQRVRLYASSAKESFERGAAAEIGLDAGLLPDFPGSNGTDCGANCLCQWVVRIFDIARGDYDVSWTLGRTEDHCTTCPARARHRVGGGWRGLRIRRGVMIDTPAPLFAQR